MQLLHYILKCNHFWNDAIYLVLLDSICVKLQAKMLLELQTEWALVKIISIPDEEYFSGKTVGCTASKFVKII